MYLYFFMATLYIVFAALMAADVSLTSFRLAEWFNGLVWLRVHLITLGALTEVFFGLLPIIAAARAKRPRPAMRWDIWLTLNVGLLTLLIGIPQVDRLLIFVGGTLVFIAATLLVKQVYDLRPSESSSKEVSSGRKFYIAGVGYLLVGIIIGTGLWLDWSSALFTSVPKETHIHANSWGFMSLVFAGLLVDLYPDFAKRPLAWGRSITPIFWMMTVGALGLTLGPWFDSLLFTVPGLILHLSATIWLVLNVVKPLWGDWRVWTPGIAHLVASYLWIVLPILFAPFLILGMGNIPDPTIEANAPQALIYGWALQFGYALFPFLFDKWLLSDEAPKLGGNWFSVVAVNLGGILLWVSIFVQPYRALLHGSACALWAISMIPIAIALWQTVQVGIVKVELNKPSTN